TNVRIYHRHLNPVEHVGVEGDIGVFRLPCARRNDNPRSDLKKKKRSLTTPRNADGLRVTGGLRRGPRRSDGEGLSWRRLERQYRRYSRLRRAGDIASQPCAGDSPHGAGLIELAARGSDNRIYHWRYRGGVWSQPAVVANQIISTPILMNAGA